MDVQYIKTRLLHIVCFLPFSIAAIGQTVEYRSPVEIPILMSGNFGEPRPNHFHCGIDIKTQGVENKRIFAVADGYVSRLTVGKNGFGNAIYITHPDSIVSVYCHLNDFEPSLQQLLLNEQYALQSDVVDLRLEPGIYPVKAGSWIAYSGNTGASAGPHLHLEFQRPLQDGSFELIDPLSYYTECVKDKRAPVAHGIKLYPAPGAGVVNGTGKPLIFAPEKIEKHIGTAWGRIGAAIWADDYMDGTYNKYGIRYISLSVDGREVFSSNMSKFHYGENPMVNAWGDYAHYKKTRHWYLKSFRIPGNKLDFIETDENDGWVDICEERPYHFVYTLEDLYGNRSVYRFCVMGKPDEDAVKTMRLQYEALCNRPEFLRCEEAHIIQQPGMELHIPAGALTEDVLINVSISRKNEQVFSNTFRLNDEYVPLLSRATLLLAPSVPFANPEKLYICSSKGYVGGKYDDGWYSAQIRELAETYELMCDTLPPSVTPLGKWTGRRTSILRLKTNDSGSGVKNLKADVDGTFVLFVRNGQTWTCRLKYAPFKAEGKRRRLNVVVEDHCGNIRKYQQTFIY